jgi:hypothetical protein
LLLLGLAAAAGIALRLYVAHGVIGDPDSDEAIPALIVRHFLHGHLNVFYRGQAYGGTQERRRIASSGARAERRPAHGLA